MIVSRTYLPVLFAGLFACRIEPDQVSVLPIPGFEKAESFMNVNNDSAFYYFNRIATSSTDSLQIATAYCYMAIIQNYIGDHYGGQESLLTSLSFLDENKEASVYCLMADYHELGNINLNLKNYDAAIEYYDKALSYMKDPKAKMIALNSKAVACQKKRDYDQAIAIYRSIIEQSKGDRKEYARVLSNYSKVKWLKDPTYHAAPEMLQAMQIRKELNDRRGLNASYSHLSEYFLKTRPESALFYAERMNETARQTNNPDDELEALSKLIPLSPTSALKKYFIRYQYLNDSVQTARNAAKNQFALIRYEAEKSKADNLRLQKDNAQKKVLLIKQQFIFGITTLLSIGVLLLAVYRNRRRRQQIELASRQAIQENRFKTSQKVHDVVANGLYRIMNSIEHQDVIEKEALLDKIEVLYEQSRDISYELPAVTLQSFQDKITELLSSFASATTKVLIIGNTKEVWADTSMQSQLEVEQILLELMINMKKHSGAQKVLIKFERQNELIHIQYNDDGTGLPPNFKFGNGLTNTENRIKKLDGRFIFDKFETKGLKVRISFPIARLI